MKAWARGVADKACRHASALSAVLPTPPIAAVLPMPLMPLMPLMPPTRVLISRCEGSPCEVEVNVVRLRNDGSAGPTGRCRRRPCRGARSRGRRAVPAQSVRWAARTSKASAPTMNDPLGHRSGQGGNEKPIQSTREVWTAPELMVTLSSRDLAPRNGDFNDRLKNVNRGQPDAWLRRVPADSKLPARPGSRASGAPGQAGRG